MNNINLNGELKRKLETTKRKMNYFNDNDLYKLIHELENEINKNQLNLFKKLIKDVNSSDIPGIYKNEIIEIINENTKSV